MKLEMNGPEVAKQSKENVKDMDMASLEEILGKYYPTDSKDLNGNKKSEGTDDLLGKIINVPNISLNEMDQLEVAQVSIEKIDKALKYAGNRLKNMEEKRNTSNRSPLSVINNCF